MSSQTAHRWRGTANSSTPSIASSRPPRSSSPRRRNPVHSALSTHFVLSIALAVLVLAVQFLAPHLPHELLHFFSTQQHWRVTSPDITLRNPVLLKEPPICPKPQQHIEFAGTFNKDTERSMALAEQAKRVAAEFEFAADDVRKAVKEFIREMGMYGSLYCAIGVLTAVR